MPDWTEHRTERLKQLWASGSTSTEIAKKLRTTRSAILGKVKRLGLQRQAERMAAALKKLTTKRHSGAKKAAPERAKSTRTKTPDRQRGPTGKSISARKAPARPTASPKRASPAKSTPRLRVERPQTSGSRQAPEKSKKPIPAAADQPKRQVARSEQAQKPVAHTERQTQKGVRIWELREGQCKWPIGGLLERPEFFCGAPTSPGSPWCQVHRAVAFTRDPMVRREGRDSKRSRG